MQPSFRSFVLTAGVCLACMVLSNVRMFRIETLTVALGVLENVVGSFPTKRNVRDIPGERLLKEYDFIVVGAGPSGCVVANRLSENPKWKVLLLEAGRDETFLNDIPAYSAFAALGDTNWGYTTEPQDNACWAMKDKRCVWTRGKALGGTSTLNYMIYSRGSRHDYDEWERLGNNGWSYEDVLPYFKKSEDIHIRDLSKSTYHASKGYLTVEQSLFHTELGKAFLDAGSELNYTNNADYNGREVVGFAPFQLTMHSGSRCSASKAFLRPVRHRENLDISLNSLVSKVIIDPGSKQATGVDFSKDGLVYTVKVRHEVVVSAGALNSPKILMLSGVGPRDHLQQLGIPVIQDSRVGHNLQDHVGFLGLTFLVNKTIGMAANQIPIMKSIFEYIAYGTGPLVLGAASESLAFVTTKYSTNGRPDIELLYASGSLNSDNGGPLLTKGVGVTTDFYDSVYRQIDDKDVCTIVPILLHPKSRGFVRLFDATPSRQPLLDPKVFSDPEDLKVLVEGIKLALKLASTNAFQQYGSTLHNVSLPGCRELTFSSDAYWECACKYLATSMHHQIGTCRMGPASEPDAVVDPELRVHGIQSLRVADASVMPLEVTGHTMAAAYMIGERVSEFIKKDWSASYVNTRRSVSR